MDVSTTKESEIPTPYAVACANGCNDGEPIFITEDEYHRQMKLPGKLWKCPRCGFRASWDDDIYEEACSP